MAPMCKSKARLDGKTVIITGANTGIGFETAKELLIRGARVIMACRSLQKARTAEEQLREMVDNAQLRVVELDLSSLKSVKKCSEEILRTETSIHQLINNAGVMMCPYELTENCYEMQFQCNHLGHFLFTLLLLPRIKASAPARIINVSSLAHINGKVNFDDLQSTKSYSRTGAYGQSKLCNILFTLELQHRLEGTGVVAYALHPGVVKTELTRNLPSCMQWTAKHLPTGLMYKTAQQGAQTTLHCALEESLATQSGLYYSDCKKTKPAKRALEKDVAIKLWTRSEELCGEFLNGHNY